MKQILSVLLVMVILLAIVACGQAQEPPVKASVSSVAPESIPEAFESMNAKSGANSDYDEFFSKSIDFVSRLNNSDVGVVFIYSEWSRDAGYIPEHLDNEPFLEAFPNAAEGQLYKWKTNTTDPDNYFVEYFLLLDEQVTEIAWVGDDRIFCAVGDTLYSIDYSGGDKQVVLTADGPITNLEANETLVFYVANEDLYRHYIPSKTTDKLCHAPGILSGFPVPLTNNQVYWQVYEPDCPEDDYRSWHVYTWPDIEPKEVSFDEIDRLYNEWGQRVGGDAVIG